jgi:hypothetical protein
MQINNKNKKREKEVGKYGGWGRISSSEISYVVKFKIAFLIEEKRNQ